jgi:hypothetical protein
MSFFKRALVREVGHGIQLKQVSYLLGSVESTSFCSRSDLRLCTTASPRLSLLRADRCHDMWLGCGKTVSEEITDVVESQMKMRTKRKVIRIGDDKGGRNEGC